MTENIYTGQVAKLFEYGDLRIPPFRGRAPYDYLADGFDQSHIPDLIRILEDQELADGDPEGNEVWAQAHAWRILGLLRAEEAIEPLLDLLRYIDDRDDDWVQDEVPVSLVQIGPAALEPVVAYLTDETHGLWARVSTARVLEEMAKAHPETRERCIQVASQQLEHFADQSKILNAALVDCLLELKAVEVAPLIEQAFASDAVDLTLRGDWEDAQVALGLIEERVTPKRNYIAEQIFGSVDGDEESDEDDEQILWASAAGRGGLASPEATKKKKRKRKEAKKQRKTQRKHKKKKK